MSYFVSNEWGKGRYQELSDSRVHGVDPAVRSILCCAALGLCSTLLVLSLWSSNIQVPIRVYVFHFDRQQPVLHVVSDKFLSFGLDTSLLRRMNELPIGQQKFIDLARHLSPAYVRIGGTSADCLTFVQDQMEQNSCKKILSPVDGQDISNFTISGADLLALYDFTVKSELRMIFDLNVLLRNPDGSWNDSNAQEIIAFTKNQGMTLDWQLGNEPNSFKHVFSITIPATELAKDYDHLRQLLNEAGYVDSILVGPEANHVGDSDEMGELYIKTFLSSQKNTVNYVTWHQYYLNGREAKMSDFVAPSTFNWLPAQINSTKQFIAESGKDVSMWLSETSTAFGGGAPGLSDRFIAGFLWLDKLGYSASAGLDVVTRQSLFGGNYAMISPNLAPNPDWWVSVFYKQFVSEKVLKLSRLNNFGYVRLYAHCTSKNALISRVPAITVYGMNMDRTAVFIHIPELFVQNSKTMISYYSLSADHLLSSEIKLNGETEALKLQPNGDLPPFRPVILDSANPVLLPPYSMAFMIIHGTNVSACSA
ncbi:heparanase isoform X1 [Mycetomoellerius zeteki]|uniref:heparanase isoform X1 n=1 Tax=Mycetomoellerius zeteki TaxID=64791 RepID=UPI00084E54D4|nr:PREDICTED: heparanase-like isoform X1 [Trachymyrmex zeteki]